MDVVVWDAVPVQVALVLIAFGLTSLVGLERRLRRKSAGLRTHALLGTGSAVFIGFLLSTRLTARLLSWVELPFTNIPVVKSIYSSLKSFADYFSPQHQDGDAQQVVILRLPGQELEVVGLITRNHLRGLPPGFLPGDRVAVYLPMGYMIGGYTLFVPRDWLTPIDMSVEEAMRSSLIAWMAHRNTP